MNGIIFQDQTFVPIGVSAGIADVDGERVMRVVKPETNTEPDVPTYARLVDSDFHDGTIEVDVRARLMHWADIDMDEWIHVKAEVSGPSARFYVDDMQTPALEVAQMFGGADLRGAVGLYVDNGTEGNFRNLQVTYAD